MNPVMHALGLHLYQPLDNLHMILRENPEELRRILLCYERIGRFAHKYAKVARIHVALSCVLLEQLYNPKLIDACREMVDIPSILEGLRSAPGVEFVGTGYRHAPLPFIPQEDWEEQLRLERELMSGTFGRVLKGYLPPSNFFSLEMIPALVDVGYEYLLLPAQMLELPDGSGADPYRPFKLSYQGTSITVVPIDGGFSQSQQYGLEAPWFADEVRNGVMLALPNSAPYLLTTWSDGENGEWFRTFEEQGFFGAFFSPYMEFCELGAFPIQPVSIIEYLRNHPAQTEALLKPELTSSQAFPGDPGVNKKLSEVAAQYWNKVKRLPGAEAESQKASLTEARALLLRAEESGLLLGEGARVTQAMDLLKRAENLITPKPQKGSAKTPKIDAIKGAATSGESTPLPNKNALKSVRAKASEKQTVPQARLTSADSAPKAPPAKASISKQTAKKTVAKDRVPKK